MVNSSCESFNGLYMEVLLELFGTLNCLMDEVCWISALWCESKLDCVEMLHERPAGEENLKVTWIMRENVNNILSARERKGDTFV